MLSYDTSGAAASGLASAVPPVSAGAAPADLRGKPFPSCPGSCSVTFGWGSVRRTSRKMVVPPRITMVRTKAVMTYAIAFVEIVIWRFCSAVFAAGARTPTVPGAGPAGAAGAAAAAATAGFAASAGFAGAGFGSAAGLAGAAGAAGAGAAAAGAAGFGGSVGLASGAFTSAGLAGGAAAGWGSALFASLIARSPFDTKDSPFCRPDSSNTTPLSKIDAD